jgi:microcystin-dependent protein
LTNRFHYFYVSNLKTKNMKKLIIAALLVAGSFGFANAQTKQKTVPKKPATAMVASKNATTTSAVKAKDGKTSSAVHVKADGTPDKRFKENKTTVKTAGPLKKDGTPDKRYKANKK